jgi:hypothetical protein
MRALHHQGQRFRPQYGCEESTGLLTTQPSLDYSLSHLPGYLYLLSERKTGLQVVLSGLLGTHGETSIVVGSKTELCHSSFKNICSPLVEITSGMEGDNLRQRMKPAPSQAVQVDTKKLAAEEHPAGDIKHGGYVEALRLVAIFLYTALTSILYV